MADLNKLNKRRESAAAGHEQGVSIKPSTRPFEGERLVQMVFRVSESERTDFKRRALDDGTSVQAVLEEFVRSYIAEGRGRE